MYSFIIAMVTCVALVLLLRAKAHHWGVVDHPGGRKQHEHPTPTVGGAAMFLAVALTLYLADAYTEEIAVLIGAAAALVVLGMLDDKHDLDARLRLLIQGTLSLLVILGADGAITHLGALFGGDDISLWLLAVPFSLVAYVGGINAMNMIDGADGMAGKMAGITIIGVGVIAYLSGATDMLPLIMAMLGAVIGFLFFNTRLFVSRAWVFMGDAGSMWLGLVLGWFMAQVTLGPVSAEPALVFWLFGIPVVDTLAVILRRVRRNASPFAADRTHIHHIFQLKGFSVSRTVLLLSIAQCFLVGVGVCFYLFKMPAAVVLWSFVLLMAAYFYFLHHFHDSVVELAKAAGHTERGLSSGKK
ncbi:MAG TPA: MraY family glycosyltransferase [Gallionellaceae bacterium]